MATIIPNIDSMMTSLKPQKSDLLANQNHASEFYKRLVSMINDFNKSLDSENEVGMQICNFGQKITVYIKDISYWNPSLIIFTGIDLDSGNQVQLIQHVSQLNILLVKLPKKNKEEPKRPIGFNTWEEYEESKRYE